MSEPVDRVEAEALRLSPRDRARLAHRLLASLEQADEPAEVDRAWQAEIERRVAEYSAGGIRTTPASDVFREARDRLRPR